MHYHIITAFPEAFDSYLKTSILSRAREKGLITVSLYNPRDFTTDPHGKIDDRPYGGGPGMVLSALPMLSAVQKATEGLPRDDVGIVLFSPHGEHYTNTIADEFKEAYKHLVLICGHYEGVDARVEEILRPRAISIGNYVLSGGELPALVLIDVLSRRLPGVLGNEDSVEELRVAGKKTYTRPECFSWEGEEYCIPEVLKSGDHAKIDEFRKG